MRSFIPGIMNAREGHHHQTRGRVLYCSPQRYQCRSGAREAPSLLRSNATDSEATFPCSFLLVPPSRAIAIAHEHQPSANLHGMRAPKLLPGLPLSALIVDLRCKPEYRVCPPLPFPHSAFQREDRPRASERTVCKCVSRVRNCRAKCECEVRFASRRALPWD